MQVLTIEKDLHYGAHHLNTGELSREGNAVFRQIPTEARHIEPF